ncbi:MAG: Fe-S cluster assembly protein SufD [Pseudomonadota bacterium]
MTEMPKAGRSLLSVWEALEKDPVGRESGWVTALRRSGADIFRQRGFPTTQDEEWKDTNVVSLSEIGFGPAPSAQLGIVPGYISSLRVGEARGPRLVFINGSFRPDLSDVRKLPPGVTVASLRGVLRSRPGELRNLLGRCANVASSPFTAVNAALFIDGAFLRIGRGVALENPIELSFLSVSNGVPVFSHPRNLIVAEEGSKASVIETYAGLNGSPYWVNPVTEIILEANARLSHFKAQEDNKGAFHVATIAVRQERDSVFASHAFQLGGVLVRSNIETTLAGEGAECTMNGLFLLSGAQHSDTHTLIDHASPHCTSLELYKGILDQKSRGVFDGKIIVRPDAQKTSARQTSRNLLLSKDALVNSTPRLEILADDVKCSHGATIGNLDEQAIFYFRSRGIGEAEAREILTRAFANEIVDPIPFPSLRDHLTAVILKKLEGATR